jgi:hypothetical protein
VGDETGNVMGQLGLGPLDDNGGRTETHALFAGSAAIDGGSETCPPPATDQRNFTRFAGDSCDIGSFELGAVQSTPTPSPTPSPTSPTGQQVAWGDNNCSGTPDSIDALPTLRYDASLGTDTGDCPDMGANISVLASSTYPWGDLDCSGAADSIDALKTLRNDAGLSVDRPQDCPDPGATVTVTPP